MGIRQRETILKLKADLEAEKLERYKYQQFAEDLFTLYPPLWAAHADHNTLTERPNFSATAVLAQAVRDVKRLDKSTHAEVLWYIEAVEAGFAARASTNPTN